MPSKKPIDYEKRIRELLRECDKVDAEAEADGVDESARVYIEGSRIYTCDVRHALAAIAPEMDPRRHKIG